MVYTVCEGSTSTRRVFHPTKLTCENGEIPHRRYIPPKSSLNLLEGFARLRSLNIFYGLRGGFSQRNYLELVGLYQPTLAVSRANGHASLDASRPGTNQRNRENVIRMKRLISLSFAVFCCICLLVATERRAYAYVDPGTSLAALQAATAVVAAVGYSLRRRIAGLFGRDKTAKKPASRVVLGTPLPVTVRKDDSRAA